MLIVLLFWRLETYAMPYFYQQDDGLSEISVVSTFVVLVLVTYFRAGALDIPVCPYSVPSGHLSSGFHAGLLQGAAWNTTLECFFVFWVLYVPCQALVVVFMQPTIAAGGALLAAGVDAGAGAGRRLRGIAQSVAAGSSEALRRGSSELVRRGSNESLLENTGAGRTIRDIAQSTVAALRRSSGDSGTTRPSWPRVSLSSSMKPFSGRTGDPPRVHGDDENEDGGGGGGAVGGGWTGAGREHDVEALPVPLQRTLSTWQRPQKEVDQPAAGAHGEAQAQAPPSAAEGRDDNNEAEDGHGAPSTWPSAGAGGVRW
jgi:hypothetical protein